MITEQDLQAAIAECQGERNPNANTCIKLAAFYTIRNEMFGKPEQLTKTDDLVLIGDRGSVNRNGYSFAEPPEDVETTITYSSDTEFGRLVEGRRPAEIWPIIDELVSQAVRGLSPRLYDAFIRKLTP